MEVGHQSAMGRQVTGRVGAAGAAQDHRLADLPHPVEHGLHEPRIVVRANARLKTAMQPGPHAGTAALPIARSGPGLQRRLTVGTAPVVRRLPRLPSSSPVAPVTFPGRCLVPALVCAQQSLGLSS